MTECHPFFSLRELDEERVRITNAWAYWLEQDPACILYCDVALVRATVA